MQLAYVDRVCQQWHAMLGHPSFRVLQYILNKLNVPCSTTDLSFCDSSKLGKMHQLPLLVVKLQQRVPWN